MRCERPVPDSDSRVVLVGELPGVDAVLDPVEIGEEAIVALAARDGRVLRGSPAGAGLSTFPPALVAAARSGKLSGSGRFPAAGGGEVLGAFSPVPGTDWFVISRQPARVAETLALEARRRATAAVVAAVVLASVLCAIAWQTIVRPLRALLGAQRRLVGLGAAPPGDEVAELARSFEALERHVQDQTELGRVFLGRYQVVEILGSGGMGTVFKGWDPRLQRPVASKTVRLGDASREESDGRGHELLREAVTAAQFSHPNIVAVYDVHDSVEAAFVAMEYVEGTDLHRVLRRTGTLTPSQAVTLGAAVARGLEAAHEHGIVHHDVKPGNILLGRDGSIKVTDFGIARFLSAIRHKPELVFGTPGYLPPEALLGQGYDESGDLFALGVILYQSLAGVRPTGGTSIRDILQSTVWEPFVPLAQRRSDLDPELSTLVDRLLEKEPKQRPESAAAVAETLERIVLANGWKWSSNELVLDGTERGSRHEPGSITSTGLYGTVRRDSGRVLRAG